ncbi:hypothetical protein J4T99_gp092 [Mycobacterium phage Bromden]|uniref:Uncharacterized protein n=1 Tax=Mycobacterium phage Bromden TaxID=2283252 RepID=A0A345MBM6_9CAUD|nr:hypothetical protein J4T99_gp092 [Mycobacterium phage Bromden]AXH67897.1 hypothetical protein SEA_BROMDEN_92 [Mycobacterium phage Bromden]
MADRFAWWFVGAAMGAALTFYLFGKGFISVGGDE